MESRKTEAVESGVHFERLNKGKELTRWEINFRGSLTFLRVSWTLVAFVPDHPCSSDGKQSACSAGDPGSSPRLGQSPGEGNSNPLQFSCLENPMNRGAWRATVHAFIKELDTI